MTAAASAASLPARALARPFVKWAGGKTGLFSQLEKHLPETFGDYYEPFAGGHPFVSELYQDRFTIYEVNARRSINSKGGKRGPVKEVIIT